jgi:uncharacterized protein (TIRG00374 family)
MRRALVGFAIAIATLVAFLLVLDPAAIWAVLRGASVPWFIAGLLAVLAAVACWAESMRRVLLAAGGHLGPVRGFAAYGTGMLGKQILPMGNAGGIAIMAYAIGREADLDLDRSLAVVTIGDFLGLISTVVLAFAGIGYVVITLPPSRLVDAAVLGVVLVGLVFVTLGVMLVYWRSLLRRVVLGVARGLRLTIGRLSDRVAAKLSPGGVDAGIQRYFATFDAAATDRRAMLTAAGLAVLGWTLFAVPLYTSAAAVGEPIAFGLVLFVVPVGGLATAVPLPGGIGGVEFAVTGMMLAVTAIEPAVAAAIVLLYRFCVYWFLILVGAGSLTITATDLRSLASDVTEEPIPEE